MISDQAAAHSVSAHWQEKCECYVIMPTSTPAQFREEEEYRCTTGSRLEIPHDTGGRREFKMMSKIVKKSALLGGHLLGILVLDSLLNPMIP